MRRNFNISLLSFVLIFNTVTGVIVTSLNFLCNKNTSQHSIFLLTKLQIDFYTQAEKKNNSYKILISLKVAYKFFISKLICSAFIKAIKAKLPKKAYNYRSVKEIVVIHEILFLFLFIENVRLYFWILLYLSCGTACRETQ